MLRGAPKFLRLSSQSSSSDQHESSSLPVNPPLYDHPLTGGDGDGNDDEDLISTNTPYEPIESFEIEDTIYEHPKLLLRRLFCIFTSIAAFFHAYFIHPLASSIEPVREGYSYISMQIQTFTTKIGNPLVINRLAYVVFISIVMYYVSESGLTTAVDGISGGGGFSSGRFYDTLVLGNSVRNIIDRRQMKENLEYLSSMPTIAGTRGDWAAATYVKKFMEANGLKSVEMDELNAFINYPNPDFANNYVELVDGSIKATLYETSDPVSQNIAFNPNSINSDGQIEAPLRFVNYGTPLDFTILQENGVPIKDHILLIFYGGPNSQQTFPEGTKVALAQEYGARAVVFISPHVDGTDDNSIRRENMALMRSGFGEVMLDEWIIEHHRASRVPLEQSKIAPKIPTIPISNKDGRLFLDVLKGEGFRFDSGFYSGNSESIHSMKVKVTNSDRFAQPIWNVGAILEGREQPEKGIIIGASRDSVCRGAMSSNTGTVVLLELVRVFTSLQRQYHWSPSRSIHFVSFDGSSYNAAGLTDWVGQRIEQLKSEGFAYIDLSDAVTGDTLTLKANPFLHGIIKNALRRVKDASSLTDTEEGMDLYSIFQLQHGGSDHISNNMIESKNYIPFINMANIPSLEVKFSGSEYPENLCYDDFSHFEKSNVDPIMAKHAQLTNVLALVALELAEAPIIPYSFVDFATSLVSSFDDLQKYATEMANTLKQLNKPKLHYDSLIIALNSLGKVVARHQAWIDAWHRYILGASGMEPSMLAMSRWRINDNTVLFNKEFLSSDTELNRKRYANALFGVPYMSPGRTDESHDWSSFPSIRDALYDNDFHKAQRLIDDFAALIELAALKIQIQ